MEISGIFLQIIYYDQETFVRTISSQQVHICTTGSHSVNIHSDFAVIILFNTSLGICAAINDIQGRSFLATSIPIVRFFFGVLEALSVNPAFFVMEYAHFGKESVAILLVVGSIRISHMAVILSTSGVITFQCNHFFALDS